MILVHTSVWIAHFRDGHPGFVQLLNNGEVACHPMIVGELSLGNFKKRELILSLLESLPVAVSAEHDEVIEFINRYRLFGKGIGYVDAHLLASASLSTTPLWTLDKKLEKVADSLHLKYKA